MNKLIAFIAFLFTAILSVTTLFGCGNAKKPEPTDPTATVEDSSHAPKAGGWTIKEAADITLPGDADAAFKKALKGLTGVNYKPVALLGTQVVAGCNYAVLCVQTAVTPESAAALKVLIIYAALDGSAEITHVADFDIGSFNTRQTDWNINTAPSAGGWTVNKEAPALQDNTAASFFAEAAPEDITAVPLAALGTQVVAGINTAYLVRVTDSSGSAALKVAVVYTDLSGASSLLGAETLSISDFNA